MGALGQTAMNILVGSCEETGAHLSAHLEGELHGLRKWRVRMHLWRCERCRAVLNSLVRAVEHIHQLGQDQFSAPEASSVANAVVDRIRRDSIG